VTKVAVACPVVAKLGKYELRRPIGSGASGTVYEAWDPDLGRRVAIKQVDLAGQTEVQQQELRARFRQEAQIAGQLSHPGVVAVHDYGEQDGSAYLVMEFVDGEVLASVLQDLRERQEIMVPDRAVTIVHGVLLALAACHRNGVLHRDIKPGNVMLARDGSVKLMDFGIARNDVSDLTARGTLIGTPAYMSPEQFDAHHKVDERSDLYACGVVLYELLAGHKPFEGDLFAVMHQVRTEQPLPPSRCRPQLPQEGGSLVPSRIPPALDALVLRAMAKRPEDRFCDVASFAGLLLQSLHDVAPSRGPRYRGLALVVGLVVMAAASAGFWLGLPLRSGGDGAAAVRDRTEATVTGRTSPPERADRPAVAQSLDVEAVPAAIAKLPCARMTATLAYDPRRLTLDGMAGDATAQGELTKILAGFPGPVLRDRLRVFPASDGLCRVIDLLRMANFRTAMKMTVGNGKSTLVDGASIHVALTMPDFSGVIRLDYITDGGRLVVHLAGAGGPMQRWKAGEQVALGPQGNGVIGSVGEPYGSDMVLIIVAQRTLLPEMRPAQEPAGAFLLALQTSIADAVRRGELVAADAVVLETVAR
jgi:serine/threonine-protein kinase